MKVYETVLSVMILVCNDKAEVIVDTRETTRMLIFVYSQRSGKLKVTISGNFFQPNNF